MTLNTVSATFRKEFSHAISKRLDLHHHPKVSRRGFARMGSLTRRIVEIVEAPCFGVQIKDVKNFKVKNKQSN